MSITKSKIWKLKSPHTKSEHLPHTCDLRGPTNAYSDHLVLDLQLPSANHAILLQYFFKGEIMTQRNKSKPQGKRRKVYKNISH